MTQQINLLSMVCFVLLAATTLVALNGADSARTKGVPEGGYYREKRGFEPGTDRLDHRLAVVRRETDDETAPNKYSDALGDVRGKRGEPWNKVRGKRGTHGVPGAYREKRAGVHPDAYHNWRRAQENRDSYKREIVPPFSAYAPRGQRGWDEIQGGGAPRRTRGARVKDKVGF